MTTPKQVLYTPVDPDDATYAEFSEEPTEDEIEFQKFKDEFKQSNEYAKVSCYRQPTTSDGRPGMKTLTFLFEAGVDEFSFSQLAGRLRDEYGTGTYRIQLRDKDNKMRMNRGISIEAPKIKGDENNPQSIIAQVSRALQDQQIRTENMFKQLQGPQTGGDAFDQMTKMMTAMGTMMAGMGITPAAPIAPAAPKTLVEQLTEFKMIKELFGGDESSEPGGDANLYTLLGKTVEAFGGPIAQAIAAGAESGALSETGVVALPAPKPEPTKAEVMTEQEQHNMAMRKNIHILIANAKAEVPPEAFATILVNNTPEDKTDDLWEFISAEDCVATIIKLEPAAEPFKQWFVDLRIAVIELMSEPEPEDLAGDKMAAIAEDNDTDGQDLQPGDDEPIISGPNDVAGVDVALPQSEASTSDDKSDGDTPSDT